MNVAHLEHCATPKLSHNAVDSIFCAGMAGYNELVDIIQAIDRFFLNLLTSLGGETEVRDQVVYTLAQMLPYVFVLAALWLFFAGRTKAQKEKNQNTVLIVLGATLLAIGLRWLIGGAFERDRPFLTYPDLHHVALPGTDNTAFPSGHALILFTVASVIYFLGKHPKLAWTLLFIAGVVALARVTAGVHYPTDILGGALLGIGLARLVTWQTEWADKQLK